MSLTQLVSGRRRQHEPEIVPEPCQHRAPVDPQNPFDRASADLASRWDQMAHDLAQATTAAEQFRTQILYLQSELELAQRDAAARISFLQDELAKSQARADEAVAKMMSMEAHFKILRDSINQVLASHPIEPTRAAQDQETEDQGELRDLISRLPSPEKD